MTEREPATSCSFYDPKHLSPTSLIPTASLVMKKMSLFRHHQYHIKSEDKVRLHELGPRFTLKLKKAFKS